jgi:hypothetical protein
MNQEINICAELSSDAKSKCVAFVLEHLLEDFGDSSFAEAVTDTNEPDRGEDGYMLVDENGIKSEWIAPIDNFILFGKAKNGEAVLDMVMRRASSLSREEHAVLVEWKEKAFQSVFEVRNFNEHSLRLFDMIAEVSYEVYTNSELAPALVLPNLCNGYFLYTTIAPTQGRWFLSGAQRPIPKDYEEKVFEVCTSLQSPRSMYRNNPGKLARAFALQKEQYDFFVKHFGKDEIIVRGEDLPLEEKKYYEAWNKEHGGGGIPRLPKFPKEMLRARDVGIAMDEREGYHHFLNYGKFLAAFQKTECSPEGLDVVIGYLKDETIPAFVFRRMRERFPAVYIMVMRSALRVMGVSYDPVSDFDALMDDYEHEWRKVYPSVHPLNERLAKYQYKKSGVGRNDPCPCWSDKKFKKCCG